MANEIEGLGKLLGRLTDLETDARRVEKPMRAAGVHMLGSIEKNFQQQGRPDRWSPLHPRTLSGRRKGKSGGPVRDERGRYARKRGGSRILIDSARLKNSMSFRLVEGPGVEVGTNVVYAPRHQFGYRGSGKGRGHSDTPARPFMEIQDEDVREIGEIFSRHIRWR
jgi:phage gpG-like protein